MKNVNFLKVLTMAGLFSLVLAGCNDPLNEAISDAKGGGAAAKPTKIVGNGGETMIIGQNVTWDSDTVYILDGFVRFRGGSVLTIEPGTIVKGMDGSIAGHEPGTLVIERSAQIFAEGTASNPIVFTSNKAAGSRAPGDWGGVVICGQAYANVAADPGAGTNNYEGAVEGVPSGFAAIRYGSINSDPTFNYSHSSGAFSYCRVEFAGNIESEGDETNGITFCAVGAGTDVHHIMVQESSDDGIEFFGGSVDIHHAIVRNSFDDDIDTDQGYYGRMQFVFVQRHPDYVGTGSGGSRAMESNGDEDNAVNTDEATMADPAYSNVTIVGPMGPTQPTCDDDWTAYNEYNDAIVVRDESQLDLMNSVVCGFPRYAVNMDDCSDYNAGGIPASYFFRNRLVYDNFVDGSQGVSNCGNGPFQANNDIRGVNGCDNPSQDVAGKAGLKRACWRQPTTAADQVPDFTIVSTSPLAGNTGPETPKFTSTRFVNFIGNPYKGIQDNNTFWDKTVTYRGASDTSGTGWDMGSNWMVWTPNVPAYDEFPY